VGVLLGVSFLGLSQGVEVGDLIWGFNFRPLGSPLCGDSWLSGL
jgi:hypothetical protein